MNTKNTPSTAASQPGRGTLALLAAACGITVGNVYLCQPLLDQIAVSLGVPAQTAGLVAVGAQVGYALGILLVLPLADVIASRKLGRLMPSFSANSRCPGSISPERHSPRAKAVLSFSTTEFTTVDEVITVSSMNIKKVKNQV